MKIPIKDIAVIKRQRKEMDAGKLKELADSIKQNGLLHPIVVRKPFADELDLVNERPYVLSVGGRRLAAHMMLGLPEIEVNFKELLDPIDAEIVELTENTDRADLTWQEEVDARSRIAELYKQKNPDANIRQTADFVGVSAAQLSKDISLAELSKSDPTLRQATSKGTALRTAAFKADINQRLANVQGQSRTDLEARLVTADARDFLSVLTSQSVDMVFTDLPYGLDYFEVTKSPGSAQSNYDDSMEPTKRFIKEIAPHLVRVVKPTGWIVLFMSYELHFWLMDTMRNACGEHLSYRGKGEKVCPDNHDGEPCRFLAPEPKPWIWTRCGKGNFGHWPELHAASRYEMIVVVNGGQAKLAKKPVEDVLPFPGIASGRLHAMQKPHDLCKELIERCSVVGEKVIDVCFGSGAHLAAAAELGRDFEGCELNPDNLPSALQLVAQFYKK